MKPVLEVCADSIESVIAARNAGASRVELCSGLSDGGLTPSFGLIRAAVATGIPVHVLIRPRSGDFLLTAADAEICREDIFMAGKAGASGVVIGALTPDGEIDTEVCGSLVQAAGRMSVTFHRAFDVCRDPYRALEDIIALGCDRILTSGQAASAAEGIGMLRRLVEKAAGRIVIMPGCGVNPENSRMILDASGTEELHASCRESVPSDMRFRNVNVKMGAPDSDEYMRMTASETIIRKILAS